MKTKILGISGSPRKKGNTAVLVNQALQGAMTVEDVETEFVNFASKKINPCNVCNICFKEDRCPFDDDDFNEINHKMDGADGIILGSPVYFGTVSAQCKAFMDRCYYNSNRAFMEKRREPLNLKVGGAIAVAAGRHAGQETTLQAIVTYFIQCDMLPVGMVSPHTQLGATGRGWDPGDVTQDSWALLLPGMKERQTSSLEAAWMFGRKIATVAKIVKAGREATKLEVPDTPFGSNMPQIPYV